MDLGKVKEAVQPVANAAKQAAHLAKEAAVDGAHWVKDHAGGHAEEKDIWVPLSSLDRFVLGQGRDWAYEGYDAFAIHFGGEYVQWVVDGDALVVEASRGAKRGVVDELKGAKTPQGHEWRYDGDERWMRAGRMVAKLAQEAFYAPRGEVQVVAYPAE